MGSYEYGRRGLRRLGRSAELFGGEGPDQLPCEDVGGIDERDAAEFLFGERERDLGAAEDDRVGVSGKAAGFIQKIGAGALCDRIPGLDAVLAVADGLLYPAQPSGAGCRASRPARSRLS